MSAWCRSSAPSSAAERNPNAGPMSVTMTHKRPKASGPWIRNPLSRRVAGLPTVMTPHATAAPAAALVVAVPADSVRAKEGVRKTAAAAAAAVVAASLLVMVVAPVPASQAFEEATSPNTLLTAARGYPGSGASSTTSSGASSGGDGGGIGSVSCPDGLCPGEVNGTLNTCSLTAPSCVSVMSDDEPHFVAPWGYESEGGREREGGGVREAAVERLLYVALGGFYEPGLSTDPYVTNGYSRIDAAGYLLQGAFSSATGRPAPSRPQPLRDSRGFRPFDGVLEDRHTTRDGDIYLRIRFGSDGEDYDGGVVGPPLIAEFLFPAGDNIVTLRCDEAREAAADSGDGAPPRGTGRLALSFERGLEWDTNEARRRMEALRKALRWEVIPVVSEFDPKFNNGKPLWFERLYEPFRSAATSASDTLSSSE